MKPLTQIKIIAVIIIMVLAAYPVFELSRCIIEYDIIGGWAPGWQGYSLVDFYFELGLMWFFYLLIPVAVCSLLNLAYRLGKKDKDEIH
jgi:hypothetical protein